MGRLRNTLAVAAVGAALSATQASAAEPAPASTIAPALEENETLAAPAAPAPSGGTAVEAPAEERPEKAKQAEPAEATPESQADAGAVPAPTPSELFEVPSIPSSSCAGSGVPPVLIPIYQRAANAYGLGPQGAAVLASINGIESAFGTNMGLVSAGANGCIHFLPARCESWGVDSNGDGVLDPYDPQYANLRRARYPNSSHI